MSKLIKGAKSLFTIAKNVAQGIDQSVPQEVEKSRLDTCLNCDQFTKTRQCATCLCFCDFKVKVRQESCPLGKWSSWTPKDN